MIVLKNLRNFIFNGYRYKVKLPFIPHTDFMGSKACKTPLIFLTVKLL